MLKMTLGDDCHKSSDENKVKNNNDKDYLDDNETIVSYSIYHQLLHSLSVLSISINIIFIIQKITTTGSLCQKFCSDWIMETNLLSFPDSFLVLLIEEERTERKDMYELILEAYRALSVYKYYQKSTAKRERWCVRFFFIIEVIER